jgi:transcriptional regulator with XRE-family HTH domain
MTSNSVGTYLRFLRRKSGLSQSELARILGTVTGGQVSRHERSVSPPTLIAAFGYQVVFQKPVSEIFPGLFHTIESGVVERIESFERDLGESTARGRAAAPVARRLEWLNERKNSESD